MECYVGQGAAGVVQLDGGWQLIRLEPERAPRNSLAVEVSRHGVPTDTELSGQIGQRATGLVARYEAIELIGGQTMWASGRWGD